MKFHYTRISYYSQYLDLDGKIHQIIVTKFNKSIKNMITSRESKMILPNIYNISNSTLYNISQENNMDTIND